MKMLLVVADADRFEAVKHDLVTLGATGYSAFPMVEGAGRTGIHAGDRVHPGALVTLLAVVPDDRAGPLFDELVRRRDDSGDRVTRLFLLPVERQA